MSNYVEYIARRGPGSYTLGGYSEGEPTEVHITCNDDDLVELADMLGFQPFYPDLDEVLAGVQGWIGVLLTKKDAQPPAENGFAEN